MILRGVLDGLIRRFLVIGSPSVRHSDGQTSQHQGSQPGPGIAFHVSDWRAVRRMAMNPALAFGEGYMDGAITPVGCSIYDALDLLLAKVAAGGRQPVMAAHALLGASTKQWAQFLPVRRRARLPAQGAHGLAGAVGPARGRRAAHPGHVTEAERRVARVPQPV